MWVKGSVLRVKYVVGLEINKILLILRIATVTWE